jgi:hypothetical protein
MDKLDFEWDADAATTSSAACRKGIGGASSIAPHSPGHQIRQRYGSGVDGRDDSGVPRHDESFRHDFIRQANQTIGGKDVVMATNRRFSAHPMRTTETRFGRLRT